MLSIYCDPPMLLRCIGDNHSPQAKKICRRSKQISSTWKGAWRLMESNYAAYENPVRMVEHVEEW